MELVMKSRTGELRSQAIPHGFTLYTLHSKLVGLPRQVLAEPRASPRERTPTSR